MPDNVVVRKKRLVMRLTDHHAPLKKTALIFSRCGRLQHRWLLIRSQLAAEQSAPPFLTEFASTMVLNGQFGAWQQPPHHRSSCHSCHNQKMTIQAPGNAQQ
jgi:hypothetical protein